MAHPSTITKPTWDPSAPSRWPSQLTVEGFAETFPGESQTVEFKQGLSSLQDSIVAFSNTAPGGFILAGVKNDGRIIGLDYSALVEDRVRQAAEEVHSPGPLVIQRLRVADRSVAAIGVAPLTEGFAQTSQGRILVRTGTRRVALIGGQLVRFMHDRAASRFEAHLTDVGLAEADPALLADVRLHLGIADGGQASGRLTERGLVALDGGREMLTVAGALYLLNRPDRVLGKAYIEVWRYPAGSNEPDRREEFMGPVNLQIAAVRDFMVRELGTDSAIVGLRRHDLPKLPERVLRETLANAVAHRSYEIRGMPVRVEMRPDAVEVTSPGGLPAPVTVETMRDAFVARNNAVIRVLRRFHLAEDSGKGVDLIQDLMRDELLEAPHFSATETSVTVRLPVQSATRPEERAWVREVVERGSIEDRDRILLVHARRGELLTNQRARELLGTGRDGATASLQRLVSAGLLKRSGKTAGTRYGLADSLAPPAGLRLSRQELGQIILEMAEGGPVANQMVRERTGLDRTDVLSLFEELVNAGKLIRVGERRGSRYVLRGGATSA